MQLVKLWIRQWGTQFLPTDLRAFTAVTYTVKCIKDVGISQIWLIIEPPPFFPQRIWHSGYSKNVFQETLNMLHSHWVSLGRGSVVWQEKCYRGNKSASPRPCPLLPVWLWRLYNLSGLPFPHMPDDDDLGGAEFSCYFGLYQPNRFPLIIWIYAHIMGWMGEMHSSLN